MTRPLKVRPRTLADYFEVMTRMVFNSGLNWQVTEAKWPGFRAAFADFDPRRVAAFTPNDVERLMADERIIRNRKKIEATIHNAGELLVTDREFGGFAKYLASFDDNDALVKDLHKRFEFLGESVAHLFLWGVGVNEQAQDEWAHAHFGNAEERHHHHAR